jgi:tRNA nucleotidyltransferase/poly(A) polymerase
MVEAWLDDGLLGRVRAVVRPWRCLLVGGAVRDHLLGRTARDLDLIVVGAREAAAALAATLEATLVELGGDRFAALRVVGPSTAEDGGFVIDLWDPGAATLDAELRRRDLTIDAVAVDLADGSWHDPTGGRGDITARCLRAAGEASFAEDPLRVLRLARLAAELAGFTAEARTVELARAAVGGLDGVAAERQREELGRTLAAAAPEPGLELWAELGLYPGWMGGSDPDAARRGAQALARGRQCLGALRQAAGTPDVDRRTLHAALLLTAAAGDLSVPVRRGRLTRREARSVALAAAPRELPAEPAAQRWLLHQATDQWPAAAVHGAVWDPALDAAGRERRLGELARRAAAEGAAIFDPQPLLRGDEIRRLLRLEAGPAVGAAARRLRRAQVEGRVSDRAAATAWLLSERRSAGAD